MCKKYFLVLILFFIAYNANTQTFTGFTFGGNLSYLTGDKTTTNEMENVNPLKLLKPGFYGGIFWNFNTGYNKFIEIGGIFSQQGTHYKDELFQFDNDSSRTEKFTRVISYNIDYIHIPLLWKQDWGDWITKLGGYGSFAINAKSIWENTHRYSDTSFTLSGEYKSFSNNMRLFDLGLECAVGVQFALNNKYDFFFTLGYIHGFIVLNPDVSRQEQKIYNRCFTLSTGIILSKNKYNRNRR